MEDKILANYSPAAIEDEMYRFWMDNNLFKSKPDNREPFCIAIPPPNVTGVLHMGHMLNNTIQDVLVRRARMQGKNACWVPGTDHASIATEAKVVAKLREEGIDKHEIGRENFLEHAWDWTHKHGGIILEQLKRLGASCDWDRTCFTMDEARYESVIDVFIDLFEKGLIYRGIRMVNWDPQAKTAVSDEEVVHKEEQSKLYYVRYRIVDSEEYVTIATTRPETILGDSAVCVNPADERFVHLKGKKVIVPMVNREVPVIMDEYVDMEFGTGCLKITPAHDVNDYEIGLKHHLEVIDILTEDGSLSEAAQLFVGVDRFVARKETVKLLEEQGNLVKTEDYVNKVGRSERTDAVIEPRISMQWFLKMEELAKPALEAVEKDLVKLHPAKFKNTYRHWMENVKDWCISRQLWWGHRLPVYYIDNSPEYVVAKTAEEALEKARAKTGIADLQADRLQQDEDVMDTWFSSWLWPISVFDGIRKPENADIQYYYPTNDLVTAPEILFFWVARMIIAGYEYRDEKPFKNVYLTGIVRDKQGRKMSKSLGNSPEPLELIKQNGADAVRVGMLFCSPAGGDLLYDDTLIDQGRKLANKIWNVYRLIATLEGKYKKYQRQPTKISIAIIEFKERFNQKLFEVDKLFNEYKISEVLKLIYSFFWNDFASDYLEKIKANSNPTIDRKSIDATKEFYTTFLKLFHPFMPFITEYLWRKIIMKKGVESIMLSSYPTPDENSTVKYINHNNQFNSIISGSRDFLKNHNLTNKEELYIATGSTVFFNNPFQEFFQDLLKIPLKHEESIPADASTFIAGDIKFFVPSRFIKGDTEGELEKLEKELEYFEELLNTIMKKLDNKKFIENAPQNVIEKELKKKQDTEDRIRDRRELIDKKRR